MFTKTGMIPIIRDSKEFGEGSFLFLNFKLYKLMKYKLIRSKSLVDDSGHATWRYNWTECIYLFGILIRTIQVKNVDYKEAIEIFGDKYKRENWNVKVYTKSNASREATSAQGE
jgi:hypothetical protein